MALPCLIVPHEENYEPMSKINIKNLSIDELSSFIDGLEEKRHRTTQILQWLYQKGVSGFDEMTNIPTSLRAVLDERFVITSLRPIDSLSSRADASQKFLLETSDGSIIEAVLMETKGHQTICISSQIGCPLRCSFCRTGDGGFERNLRSDEILNQVLFFKRYHLRPGRRFNIVFMGMGEPFLNMENLVRSVEILNAIEAFALGEKRITISTIGYPERIRDLTGSNLKFSLAVSLNATTDRARKGLMPSASGIADTLAAAEEFARGRKTRVTLEYVLISGLNDTEADARRLASMTSSRPFKINLIPFNEWGECPHRRPDEDRIERFVRLLLPTAPAVTVRRSQGADINAACGQLRLEHGRRRKGED
jgi:23S rRNA (adenine2503-C2)-methyltransferase